MTNRRSATGVGAGELSEYLLSHAILEKHCGIDPILLHEKILSASSSGERRAVIAGTGGARVVYRFDGKTLEAAREYAAHLTRPNTLVTELEATAADVSDRLPVPSAISELWALGASGTKADLTLVGPAGDTPVQLSLKYGHHAAARYQSPTWAGVVRAYRSIGADIGDQRSAYLDAHRLFMTPQLRNSRQRGDYSTQLRANCDAIVDAHHRLNLLLQGEPGRIDRAALAAGILRGYTGGAANIHLIDMRDGSIAQIRHDSHHQLHRLLDSAPLQVAAQRSETGRTLTLNLSAGGRDVARLYTTASTNRARRQSNPDLRTPKPQTYLIPNLGLLSALECAPRKH